MNLIKSISIKESIEQYLNWKKSHTHAAYDKYKVRLDHFANYLKKQNLDEVDPDDIVNFHNQMLETYSPATVAYSARILRNFFIFHAGRNHTNVNPKEIISIRFISPEKDIVEKKDVELINELLNEKYLKDLQKKVIINMLWDTGMRISELLELKISNINDQGENGLRTAKIKTRKAIRYDLVAWGSGTDELLTQYLAWRLLINHPTDYIFVSTTDTKRDSHITVRTIERWVKQLCKEAMIDRNLTPHSFRHGKSHNMLDNGATAVEVQAILRHKNLECSKNYMRLNKERYLRTASKYLQYKKEGIPTWTPSQFPDFQYQPV